MNLSETYTKLASVPLFTGLSGEDLYMVCEKVHLRWVKLYSGQTLIQENEPCTHLTILIQGELNRTTDHDQKTWSVTDVVRGPIVIEPDQLYGLKCRYRSRYEARTDCQLLLISKDDMRRTLMNLPLWRTNLLNLMASNCVKEREWNDPRQLSLGERIMRFGLDHYSAPDCPHWVRIRQVDLGGYIGETRRTISMEVHKLIDEGLMEIRPNLMIVKPQTSTNKVKSEE